MICPHCSTTVKFQWENTQPLGVFTQVESSGRANFIKYAECPSCEKYVIYYTYCDYYTVSIGGQAYIDEVLEELLIYPQRNQFQFKQYIPGKYLEDYEEAFKVLSLSPKASAALTRRLLQLILRDEYNIKERSLSQEIEKFIQLPGIPSHLTDAVDAIRNIGNLAAHPIKNKKTGQIVPVEPGEAEWLIDVIEALFDFCFVQPKKLEQRRAELNEKLESIGKPQLKKKEDE